MMKKLNCKFHTMLIRYKTYEIFNKNISLVLIFLPQMLHYRILLVASFRKLYHMIMLNDDIFYSHDRKQFRNF